MLRQLITEKLYFVTEALLLETGIPWPEGLTVEVDQPARLEHGDYTATIALHLARYLRRPPLKIATEISERLSRLCADGVLPFIAKLDVVPPGFVNLFLNWTALPDGAFEYQPATDSPQTKVVVEHTSINPNKSAHVGHLRNSCIGDALARLLARTGHEVEVHNYIDDLGNQVADTVVGLLHVPVQYPAERFGDFCWDLYARVNQEYKADAALESQRAKVLHALEEGNNNVAWLGGLVAERIVTEHLAEMKAFQIDYDLLVWESNIVREGFWAAAFALLQSSPLFVKEQSGKLAGCWVLRQPGEGGGAQETDHNADKVLVRSNGVLTYTAKDIAYHLWKFGLLGRSFSYRKFSSDVWTTATHGAEKRFGRAARVINVIDRRQEYPQRMVKLALETLGFAEAAQNLHHVGYGVVSLSPETASRLGVDTSDGKASYAMSGRQGIGVKVSELLDHLEETINAKRTRRAGIPSRKVAAAAIRYYLLRHSLVTEIVFDLNLATEVTGNTGVYLMYAHARASSILLKGGVDPSHVPSAPSDIPPLNDAERALLRHLVQWPDTLREAAGELAPNLICTYAYELAALFSTFYTSLPVLKAEAPVRNFRLWLTALFRRTLADALETIGLPTPNRM
ncbi:MAG TPA: arginine--tRNA ligase [Symbiobacteriaceae bacterium]|nr:arginine--tRNA ligase [Symbiobacteriaceae bacterium]